MWALITDGRVSETTDLDPSGRFHPSLVWVKCSARTECGDLYKSGKFSKPVPELPSDEQQRAMRRAAYSAESDPLFMAWQADPSEAKKLKWLAKRSEIEARFPLTNDAADGGANV